jgi:TraK protein
MSNLSRKWKLWLARVPTVAALLLAILAVDASRVVHAQQLLLGEDGKDISIDIPAKGLTLFKAEGAKLLKVRHLEGDLAIETDAEKGEVTVRPLKASGVAAFFLVTETATIPVNAFIDKAGSGAKSVIVRVPAPAPLPSLVATRRAKGWQGPPQEYVRAIKNMVVAATAQNLDETSYEVVRRAKALAPVDSLHLYHDSTISAISGLTAHRYIISNPTDRRLTIDERRLYAGEALAVAVERVELEPGDTTLAVIVLNAGD